MVGVVSSVITNGVIQNAVQSKVSFLAFALNSSTTNDVMIATNPTIKTVAPKMKAAAMSSKNSIAATNIRLCCDLFILYSSQVFVNIILTRNSTFIQKFTLQI